MITKMAFETDCGEIYTDVPYDTDKNQWLYGKTIDEIEYKTYEEENKDNVFRYEKTELEPEEFSYQEFFGIEDIEEFEKSGNIWG